ncbi:MAG: response regulator [Nitrospirae bacterium YQR-1]
MKSDNELLKTLTVLCVDNDELLRKILGRMLRRKFAKVYEAENGREGLKIYRDNCNEIDIVIADVEMPVMGGLTMIDKILEINASQQIIITTAYNDQYHLSGKVCDNVVKPIVVDKLLQSVLHCLGLKTGT